MIDNDDNTFGKQWNPPTKLNSYKLLQLSTLIIIYFIEVM